MSVFKFSAMELYTWLTTQEEMVVLDVRNKVDFARFKVESPYPFTLQNISYFDFDQTTHLVERSYVLFKMVCNLFFLRLRKFYHIFKFF